MVKRNRLNRTEQQHALGQIPHHFRHHPDGGDLLFAAPVYHVQALNEGDTRGSERFKIIAFARHLTPAPCSVSFGLWLWLGYGISGGWLHARLTLVLLLMVFHGVCWSRLRVRFRDDHNAHFQALLSRHQQYASVPAVWHRDLRCGETVLMTGVAAIPSNTGALFRAPVRPCLSPWALSQFAHVETIGFNYGQRHRIEMDVRLETLRELRAAFPSWREPPR